MLALAIVALFGLVFAGDSLAPEVALTASLGEPETTFADSLQQVDPFGVRSSQRLQPDTTRGRADPLTGRQAVDRDQRDRQGKLQTGAAP